MDQMLSRKRPARNCQDQDSQEIFGINRSPSICKKPRRAGACYFCQTPIYDQYFITLQPSKHKCHILCLKCKQCVEKRTYTGTTIEQCINDPFQLFNQPSCFMVSGYFYCLEHYLSMQSQIKQINPCFENDCLRCFSCEKVMLPSELVNRLKSDSNFIHTRCFRCVRCNKQIGNGEEYSIHGKNIICPCDNIALPVQEQTVESIYPCTNGMYSQTYQVFVPKKNKRDRTRFTNEQLSQLKSYFSINPNPDSKEIEQLCNATNLTKRVVQDKSNPNKSEEPNSSAPNS